VSELYDRCAEYEYESIVHLSDSYHHLINSALEIYIKQELEKQRSGLWNYALNLALKEPPDNEQFEVLNYIFHVNNIDPVEFGKNLKAILNKENIKINTLRLVGAPNSGKTLLANLIVEPFITCYMNNHASENEFYLSNMLNKSIILCEELYVTTATAEDFKSVLAGQPIDISKKHQEKQLLSRTPVIITSNYVKFGRGHLPAVDENALALRCYNYHLNHEVRPTITVTWPQLYLFLYAYQ